MKTSRIALFAFAAIVGIGSLIGSAQISPAAAGQFAWLSKLGNDDYKRCLQYIDGRVSAYPYWDQAAARKRGYQTCNRQHYGH